MTGFKWPAVFVLLNEMSYNVKPAGCVAELEVRSYHFLIIYTITGKILTVNFIHIKVLSSL